MFRCEHSIGQENLRRILHAYSRHDREVGYCQGMGFITAMLLTYMVEEEAFFTLDFLMNRFPSPMRGLYLPGMPLAKKMIFVADKLTKRFLPRLWRHLSAQNVHPSMYMVQWFVTVYTNSFPFEMVTRVWDVFLFEGWKVAYRVQLGLLKISEKVSGMFFASPMEWREPVGRS